MLVHRGNYARTYAFNLPESSDTVFRKADWMLNLYGSKGPNDCLPLSTRLSSAEQTRRHLGQLISSSVGDASNKRRLETVRTAKTPYDDQFLKRKKPSIPEKSRVHASCFVARALSDHHWIEEWANITERGVNFYHPERKKANHRVGIQSITKVNKLDSNLSPKFPNYSFLSLETLGRTTYLMFASETDRDDWVRVISRLAKLAPSAVDSMETESEGHASTALLELQNPKDEFLHKSSLWDFKHRRVLNCRRFSFRAREKASRQDPLSLAEDALHKALDPRNESDDDILVSFLDSAAKLKEANVHGLGEEERLAFFLNVYHTMVMHAYLVLGTPASSFQWISYFNSISYQCSDDIFSLAELEHCILRSPMSYPTQFLSRFAIPKSSYSFALTRSDYRINFGLNCGSMSNPKCVPVFKVSSLNQQLNDVSRLYLAAAVKVKKRSNRDVEVLLPRICLWFADDFGSSNTDVLRRVTPFLTTDVQDFLKSIESGKRGKCHVSVKYLNYSFECRKLTLTPETGNRS
ncbi:Protein of unknown function, DUF547 [Seminavis robusta]|uniref:DUF547 domain-containing protein n=1 Tax=Seminavis robusta TaxID=568900 RepID=A0A9N8F3G8_9STRA|nr:Protein of unknown function, DUF547 [Seminavis robusta]|eukprot:Sro3433_g347970.1 Protein of unknown function, DUF547 (522) ;mRNA; f:21-1586